MDKQITTVIKARPAVEAKHYEQAIEEVSSWYGEDMFPADGTSIDCGSASMARLTCKNVARIARELAHAEQENQE